jgi:hypothetical protein
MSLPSYDLEVRAADERRRLHTSMAELKECLTEAVDVKKNVRQHLGLACGVAAIFGLAGGYAVGAIFTVPRRNRWL